MSESFPSFPTLDRELRTQLYASIPFPLNNAQMGRAMEAYLAFLALPQDVKDRFTLVEDIRDAASDTGYVRSVPKAAKDGAPAVLDLKEYFHFTTRTEEKFGHHADDVPAAREFLSYAHALAVYGRKVFRDFTRQMVDRHPGMATFLEGGLTQNAILRFLKYDVQACGAKSAKGHFDRSGWTLALAESDTGLRFGTRDGALMTPVAHRDNRALVFPGLAVKETASYLPAYHDVVQTRDIPEGSTCARWAIVMFFSNRNTGETSHAATHPGLYDKEPGK